MSHKCKKNIKDRKKGKTKNETWEEHADAVKTLGYSFSFYICYVEHSFNVNGISLDYDNVARDEEVLKKYPNIIKN